MSRLPENSITNPPAENCLARAVADVMIEEPNLEAVTIPGDSDEVQIATLGNRPITDLEGRVKRAISNGLQSGQSSGCRLLDGMNNCQSCPQPLDAERRARLTITRSVDGATFSRLTCPTAPTFWKWHRLRLPKFVQRELEIPTGPAELDEWKAQLAAAAICGVLGIVAHFWPAGSTRLAIYCLAYLAGAWFAAHETWERLRRSTVDVHFLMLAVAVGSASIGAWTEGATLLFLFSLSGGLEHYALGRTQREISALFKDTPRTAIVIEESGERRETPIEELRVGMRLVVQPGSQFPVDAIIARGETAADESNLTGESNPVEKKTGATVLAGTLNLWGAVQADVLRIAAQSSLQKIIRLIREAQRSKAPSQRLTDRFGSGYTIIVMGMTLVMFFVWWRVYDLPPFVAGSKAASAFYRAMTLLVVASPCALVLSIPSAILAAIAWAARRGILFRGGAAVETLADVNLVALDKTGTITTGDLTVENIVTEPPGRPSDLGDIAASLAQHSTHPLSRALVAQGHLLNWRNLEVEHLESVSGKGISGKIDHRLCLLGRREFVESLADETTARRMRRMLPDHPSGPAKPEVWVATEELVGRIQFHDEIRPQSAALIQRLRELGLRTVLLTGDRRENAEAIAREIPLDEVRGELSPDDKLSYILRQNEQGMRVAMVGDGVNDAPGLAAAQVGVAMGARGSDTALEQADVVLMRDRLENFLSAFELSRRARRIIQQNLFLSLGTVIVLVGFALAGQIPLTLGVVGHEGSTVVVVMNSLRLLLARDAHQGLLVPVSSDDSSRSAHQGG